MIMIYGNKVLTQRLFKTMREVFPHPLPPVFETSLNSWGSTYSQGNSLKTSWAPCKYAEESNLSRDGANMISCKDSQLCSSICPAL